MRHFLNMIAFRVITLSIVLYCLFHPFQCDSQPGVLNKTLTIAYAFPWSHDWPAGPSIGSAFVVGLREAERRQLLAGYSIEWVMQDTFCIPQRGVQVVVDMWHSVPDLDAIIGPACSIVCEPVGLLAAAWGIPIVSTSAFTSTLSDKSTYPTFSRPTGPTTQLAKVYLRMAQMFGWKRFGIITTTQNLMTITARATKELFEANGITVFYHTISLSSIGSDVNAANLAKQRKVIGTIKKEARIILALCMTAEFRSLLISAYDEGMLNGDYAFIGLDIMFMTSQDFDYRPEVNQYIYNGFIDTNIRANSGPGYENFAREVIEAFQEPEFAEYPHLPLTADISEVDNFAGYVHDAVLIWAYGVNKTLQAGNSPDDGFKVTQNVFNLTFQGITGKVFIDENGDGGHDQVLQMYQNGEIVTIAEWFAADNVMKKLYKGENSEDWSGILWYGNATKPPFDTPPCGWEEELCQQETHTNVVLYVIVIVILVFFLLIVILVLVGVKKYRFESALKAVNTLGISWAEVAHTMSYRRDKEVIIFNDEFVLVERLTKQTINLQDRTVLLQLKAMRELADENVCKFIGFCDQVPNVCILMAYAERGSLRDVLCDENIKINWDFKISLVTDIAFGMWYLHQSDVGYHGRLTSSKCIIDNRWTCKITGHGLETLRGDHDTKPSKLLWCAPELLRVYSKGMSAGHGSKQGDVFSFAIIVQEIVLEDKPYAFNVPDIGAEDIVKIVQKGGSPCYRPIIPSGSASDAWVDLMVTSWQEDPIKRPNFETIIGMLQTINKGKAVKNVVDKMLSLLETHTRQLEERVSERSREIIAEQGKMESLLNELLPASVAAQLTTGKHVQSQTFEAVTIFFSDIVGFTRISAAATPMEVVVLLNNMYTLFDDVAKQFDVYKVATIGDAYMVASGVPTSNGDQHASEICHLAVSLLESIKQFIIPHLPKEHLRQRIGVHTGACVAGVTGIKMPRYLLFGDTVDIAAKMESGGEAMKIHISQTTRNTLLTDKNANKFTIIKRGEMFIKGKGEMTTYWLSKQ